MLKHEIFRTILTVATLHTILGTTAMASEPSSLDIHIAKVPITKLAVSQGLWKGTAILETNGHSIRHTVSVCISSPKRYLQQQTGANTDGGYVPPNCKLFLTANTNHDISYREICVPQQFMGTVTKIGVHHIHSLTLLPAYLDQSATITLTGAVIQATTSRTIKVPEATKGHRHQPSYRLISNSMHGDFRLVSTTCPKPVKVPLNKHFHPEPIPGLAKNSPAAP